MKVLQQLFRCHCIEKFKGSVFMYSLSGKLWILTGVLLPYLYVMQIHVFSIGQETISKKFHRSVQKKLTDQWTKLKLQKGQEVVFRLF